MEKRRDTISQPELHFTHAQTNNIPPCWVFSLIAFSDYARSTCSIGCEKIRELQRGSQAFSWLPGRHVQSSRSRISFVDRNSTGERRAQGTVCGPLGKCAAAA